MHEDHAKDAPRTRKDYLQLLRKAGHKGSAASASIIVSREAKRIFAGKLPRATKSPAGARRARGAGRKPSPATSMLREHLASDKAAGKLRDAAHYTRWLVDKAGIGIKQARPVVYRELRAIK